MLRQTTGGVMASRRRKIVLIFLLTSVAILAACLWYPPHHYSTSRIRHAGTLGFATLGMKGKSPKEVKIDETKLDMGNTSYHTTVIPDLTSESEEFSYLTTLSPTADHASRIQHLKSVCQDQHHSTITSTGKRKKPRTDFFYSKAHNFTFCKVPKSGSTFWMQLFLLLKQGPNYAPAIFKMSRLDIHIRSAPLQVNPMAMQREGIRTLLVARNPYSRLFSAYIDKVYLPLMWNMFSTIPSVRKATPFLSGDLRVFNRKVFQGSKGVTPVCANKLTFTEFLTFIINEVKAGRSLEPHWAPIESLCRPCQGNTYLVVKQETFVTDVEYALGDLGLNGSLRSVLVQALHDSSKASSVPGIIRVLTAKSDQRAVRACIGTVEAAERIWKSLKIQGIIDNRMAFPLRAFAWLRRLPQDEFIQLALDAVQRGNMSTERSKEQRRSYLTEAYRSVPKDVIRDIQDIYHQDFALFQYSVDVPS